MLIFFIYIFALIKFLVRNLCDSNIRMKKIKLFFIFHLPFNVTFSNTLFLVYRSFPFKCLFLVIFSNFFFLLLPYYSLAYNSLDVYLIIFVFLFFFSILILFNVTFSASVNQIFIYLLNRYISISMVFCYVKMTKKIAVFLLLLLFCFVYLHFM